ncbi:hypothetical protein FRX31_025163 [Thalictrum thalictroides]|uniref:DUF4283 domain-containing protein n=1 Tax=Thalictrum thalictroides TaxID=46969 RepID=A0A7J6VKW4_THATH|nr:hypothetical protein FRX31_025163 [Thalictrum thalictroides]
MVREALKRQWKLKADFEMVADKDYFFFKFTLEEDRTTVLEAGPVFIEGRIFIIQPWNDMTEKDRSKINTIPIGLTYMMFQKNYGLDQVSAVCRA